MAVTDMITEVTLTPDDVSSPRFTPRELRLIQEQFGRSFSALMSDETSDDKFVVFAWLKMRRDGEPVDVADMDDVLINLALVEDPTRPQLPTG